MQPATDMTDDQRWLALFLRNACAPRWSFKTLALSGPSIRTIAHGMMAQVWTISEEEAMRREVSWQTAMIKAGMKLGLGSYAMQL